LNVETDFGAEGGDGERGFVGESEAFGEGGEEGVRGGRGAVVVDDHIGLAAMVMEDGPSTSQIATVRVVEESR
jgi:hypothetical protein